MKRFSASSAAQLMACPGSANLEVSIPGFVEPVRVDSAGAKGVGTRLHEVMEPFHDWDVEFLAYVSEVMAEFAEVHWRKRRPMCDDEVKMMEFVIGLGIQQTDDNIERVGKWLMQFQEFAPALLRFVSQAAFYMADLKSQRIGTVWVAEATMTALWLDSKPMTTPDVVGIKAGVLDIIDYKSGKIEVSPIANAQLLFYAMCVLFRQPHIERVILHILQPGQKANEPAHLEAWECTREYVLEWAERAKAADRAIIAGSTQLSPSGACTFCPANPWSRGDKGNIMCPAMMERLYPSQASDDEILSL